MPKMRSNYGNGNTRAAIVKECPCVTHGIASTIVSGINCPPSATLTFIGEMLELFNSSCCTAFSLTKVPELSESSSGFGFGVTVGLLLTASHRGRAGSGRMDNQRRQARGC